MNNDEVKKIDYHSASISWDYIDPDEIEEPNISRNGRKRLAVCIPTYERADVVEDYLNQKLSFFEQNDIDIYIYDSSGSNDTETIVAGRKENSNVLHYVRLPEKLHSNMKVFKIYQKFGWVREYDYVWMSADYLLWKEDLVQRILSVLDKDYDILAANIRDYKPIGDKEYTDLKCFAKDVGWYFTLFGSVILNVSKLLEDVEWDYLNEKYYRQDTVNFSHVGLYLEQLAKLKSLKAYHFNAVNQVEISKNKPISEWKKDYWFTWCHCFPKTVNILPEYFDDVKKEILLNNGRYARVLNLRNFLLTRKDNNYDCDVYHAFEKSWTSLTTIPLWLLQLIAMLPIGILNRVYNLWMDNRSN